MLCRSTSTIADAFIERVAQIWRHKVQYYSTKKTELKTVLELRNVPEEYEAFRNRKSAYADFHNALLDLLYEHRDNGGRPSSIFQTRQGFPTILATNSQPVGILSEAARLSGVPGTWFPPNTFTAIERGCIHTVTQGGANRFHYPTSRGWFICNLTGGDMPRLIKAYEAGEIPKLSKFKKGLS